MNRTASSRLSAGALLAASVGGIAPLAGAADWVLWANMTEPAYESLIDNDLPAGFRVTSVNAHGSANDPRFAVVAIPDAATPWQVWHGWDADEFQSEGAALVNDGYTLVSVDMYGTYPNERYVTAWAADGLPVTSWRAHHHLSIEELWDLHNDYTDEGFRMTWVSAIGTTPGNRAFTAIWQLNSEGWSTDVHFTASSAGYQTLVEENAKSGFRPTCVNVYGSENDPIFCALFLRPDGPNWEIQSKWQAAHEQTGPQLEESVNDFGDQGYQPICAVGYGDVDDPRFAHLWVEEKAPAVFSKTGQAGMGLTAFDAVMESFMVARKISRGALAVTHNGRLVYTRGFTYDSPGVSLTEADARFRIASISKPITSAAIMQLVESGEISLDTKLVDLPGFVGQGWGNVQDADDITIRLLLQHRAGFDNNWQDNDSTTFEPMFRDALIEEDQSCGFPISTTNIIEYMKSFQLPFQPGEPADDAGEIGYAYSNFGYSLLGRVIEAVTGQDYESYVLENVLCPVGAGGMRIGGSLLEDALPDEVEYRDPMNRFDTSVIDGTSLVPVTYGSFNVRNFDAHGGWVGSAVEIARFANAFTDPANCPILSEDSIIDTLWNATSQSGSSYGAGWQRTAADDHWYHNGQLVGSFGYVIRRPDGVTMSVLFNQASAFTNSPVQNTDSQIRSDLMDAADTISSDPFGWPTGVEFFDEGESCEPSDPGDPGTGDPNIFDLLLTAVTGSTGSSAPTPARGKRELTIEDFIDLIANLESGESPTGSPTGGSPTGGAPTGAR